MSQLQTGIYVWRRGSVNIGEFSVVIHLKSCVFGMQILIFIILLFMLCFVTCWSLLAVPTLIPQRALSHRHSCTPEDF